MDIETQENTESVENNSSTDTVSENTDANESSEEGAKYQPNSHDNKVEFTPEQQKRFNQVFAKASKAERELGEFKEIASQQAQVLSDLQRGQQTIVNHIQETNYVDTENSLKQQRQAAYAKGDFGTVDAINDRLNDLRVEKKFSERSKPVLQNNIVQQPAISGEDIINTSVRTGAISPQDAEAYRSWANELDENGSFIRPWVNEHDMRGSTAAIEGRAVFANQSYANMTFAQKLMEIDKRMGVKPKMSQQLGVLPSGNLTRGGKNSNIQLSPEIEKVAIRSKFAGPGKSNQEHIDAYRKQLSAYRKGASK